MRFLVILLALMVSSHSASADTSILDSSATETCRIYGQITKTEKWLYTPYGETPSQFNEVYQRVTLDVKGVQSNSFFCKGMSADQDHTYIICAPYKPEVGDVITATAGPAVGSSKFGCLFDIEKVKMPEKKAPETPETSE